MKKLQSLSIFFPFYNDEKTVDKQIKDAYVFGRKVAEKLEVIAIHGGRSNDKTWIKILKQKKIHPDLKIIDKTNNTEGYAVIKYGLNGAIKQWIFYTDGDAQYHLDELEKLVQTHFATKADVINGFKKQRGDGLIRKLVGYIYNSSAHLIYHIPISDLDCDYRLIKKTCLEKIRLNSRSGQICLELITKLQKKGVKFAEVEVHHYPRIHGRSEFFNLRHVLHSLWENTLFIVHQQ